MKENAMPAVRLMLAGRVIQRLSMSDNRLGLIRIVAYIERHPERFGIRGPLGASGHDVDSLADAIVGESARHAQTEFGDRLKIGISYYLASLMGNDHPRANALVYLTLATVDDVVRDLATVAVIGEPANRRVYAVPYEGLALLLDGDDPREALETSIELLKREEYVATNLVQAVTLKVSRNTLTGAPVVSEHPPTHGSASTEETESSEAEPANALKLHDRIALALRGRQDEETPILAPSTSETAPREEFRTMCELLVTAAKSAHPGIHVGYRGEATPAQTCRVADQVLAHGRSIILIDEHEANTALVGIVASQVRAWLAPPRPHSVPALVVPDENELVSAQVYEVELETVVSQNGASASPQYDTEIMTPQKRLLYIIGPRIITPTLWILRKGVPVTRELVGLFSEIRPVPHDGAEERQLAIASMASDHGLTLDDALLTRISSFAADPAELAGAFRRAAMTGGVQDLEGACRSVIAGAGLNRALPNLRPERFDIRLVSTKVTFINPDTGQIERENTLDRVIEQFVAKKHRPIKILFHGAPGTSKTSLGRYIASRMGMELAEMKPSRILGKFVGDNEKALADFYASAREKKQFILIDEADSFMSQREDAKNAWERTTVNEMLTQMDEHDLPMGCTTNFVGRLDRAALRRFQFRIEAEPLNIERAKLAWECLLNLRIEQCPDTNELADLTVNDFAIVAEKMAILEITSPLYAMAALKEERNDRRLEVSRPIGFLAS
jgi:hypothetical protein